mmetsp:Transcript_44475/g.73623  ORF Transcript_44475/g.73623 Transcript_44475/m.73623 type:complete len:460 (+) Transcript_44475:323-1702(+)
MHVILTHLQSHKKLFLTQRRLASNNMQSFLEESDDETNEMNDVHSEAEHHAQKPPNSANHVDGDDTNRVDDDDDDDDDDEDYNFSLEDIDWDKMAKSMGDTVEVVPSNDQNVPPLLLKKLRLVSNEPLLQQKLQDLQSKSNGLSWYETLTVSTKAAVIEEKKITRQKQKQKQNAAAKEEKHVSKLKNNDIKREIYFYEHTLEAIKEAVDRVKLEIPNGERLIQRPNDYYAEMIKSDDHMKKIKGRILWEQKKIGIVENRKKNKRLKKYHKQMMSQKMKGDAQERKEQQSAIEDWKQDQRRGDQTLQDIMKNARSDYLNKMKSKQKHKPNMRRIMKNLKYGNGGGQPGLKGKNRHRNTFNSTNNFLGDWNKARKGYGRGGGSVRGNNNTGRGGGRGGGSNTRFNGRGRGGGTGNGKGNLSQYNKNVKRQRGILGKKQKQAPRKRPGNNVRKRMNQKQIRK